MLLLTMKTPDEIKNAEIADMCGCALRRFDVPIHFSFDGFPSVLSLLLLVAIGVKIGELFFGYLAARWRRAQSAL